MSRIGRALHMSYKGSTLSMVIVVFSVMSNMFSPTLSHSKHYINDPKVKVITLFARPSPGEALLPIPKGMNLHAPTLPADSNHSGLELVGSSHSVGSLWRDHAFTNNMVPAGTWYPPMVQSEDGMCGGISGVTGHKRRFSDIML